MNLRAGRQPLLHAEDVLRYKARGIEVNKQAVIDLFRAVRSYPGVKGAGISHFALSTVASAPDVVEEISNILEADKKHWISGQTGIETGSPKMMSLHMKGKCKPFTPEDWPEVVLDAFQILAENNWVPCSTLILGLPGETEEDLELTISLVEKLRPFKSLIVPLFLVEMGGLEGKASSFTAEKMTAKHGELFVKCWEHDLEWTKPLFKDWVPVCTKDRITRSGLGFIFSYGVKETKKLLKMCEREYNYDLPAMIRDFRSGVKKFAPLPVRLLKPLLG